MCVEQNHNSHASDNKLIQLEETVSDLKLIVDKLLRDSKSKSEEIYKLEYRVKTLEAKYENNGIYAATNQSNVLNNTAEKHRYIDKDDKRTNKLIENDKTIDNDWNDEYRTDEPQMAELSKMIPGFDTLKKQEIRKKRKCFNFSLNT